MKIIGLRIEKYVDKEISGHNCDFEFNDAEFEKHILCAVLSDNRKVEIELWHSEGECYSGWTTASWGHIKVTEVLNFGGYTHSAIRDLIVDDIEPNFEGDIENDVFSVSEDGGDSYYPGGNYDVKMELFKPTARGKEKRPVWIFKGKSDTGKSYLAHKLQGLDIYETDSNSALPEKITESVIVLGNKHKFTLEQVKEVIFGDAEIQIVNFQ